MYCTPLFTIDTIRPSDASSLLASRHTTPPYNCAFSVLQINNLPMNSHLCESKQARNKINPTNFLRQTRLTPQLSKIQWKIGSSASTPVTIYKFKFSCSVQRWRSKFLMGGGILLGGETGYGSGWVCFKSYLRVQGGALVGILRFKWYQFLNKWSTTRKLRLTLTELNTKLFTLKTGR